MQIPRGQSGWAEKKRKKDNIKHVALPPKMTISDVNANSTRAKWMGWEKKKKDCRTNLEKNLELIYFHTKPTATK